VIVDEHGGAVPTSVSALEELPGVGPYTARAVAATAFGVPVAPVDTNVRRVVSRVIAYDLSPHDLQVEADRLMAPGSPAEWAHGTMELGATVCQARAPHCGDCPVAKWCASAGQVTVAAPRARTDAVPFEATTRWLRGRIVEVLRDAEPEIWTRLPSRLGRHDEDHIDAAIEALERDGLLERSHDGAVRLPSGSI
jgi:A/G-specific adenine glycosylase